MGLADDVHNAISTNGIFERDKEFPFRHHLGASLLGHNCDRFLWFSFRWAREPSHSARIQRLFERGRTEELKIIDLLRKTGLVISTTVPELCENLQLPVQLSSIDVMKNYGLHIFKPMHIDEHTQIKANFPPHLGGSMDGIIHVPANYVGTYGYFMPIEVKTHNHKSFTSVIKNKESTRWNKPQHYVQGNAYAVQTGCTHFMYAAENKNTDELYLRDETASSSTATLNITRGVQIVQQDSPLKLHKTTEVWQCNMCDYKPMCKSKHYHLLARNCRTCVNASPTEDGAWTCLAQMTTIVKETEIERAATCADYGAILQ